MKILAIEASGLVASAALWEDGIIRAEYTVNERLTHSQTLLPMIEDMLRVSEEALSSVSAIAVSAGPGSFTGLRIGAATAKGLALAMNIPVISVSSLRALAENEADADAVVVPIMDARRGQVYTGAWHRGEELIGERAEEIDTLLLELKQLLSENEKLPKKLLFLGDGVPVHRARIEADASLPAAFAAANAGRQRAASAAQLGAALYSEWLSENGLDDAGVRACGADEIAARGLFSGAVMNSDELVPVYLRKPQAEREKDAGLLEDPGARSLRKLRRGQK